jgi:hypothetical protein
MLAEGNTEEKGHNIKPSGTGWIRPLGLVQGLKFEATTVVDPANQVTETLGPL